MYPFQAKLNILRRELGSGLSVTPPLFPLYICKHENQARKPHLSGIPGNTSVHTS